MVLQLREEKNFTYKHTIQASQPALLPAVPHFKPARRPSSGHGSWDRKQPGGAGGGAFNPYSNQPVYFTPQVAAAGAVYGQDDAKQVQPGMTFLACAGHLVFLPGFSSTTWGSRFRMGTGALFCLHIQASRLT